MLLNMFRVSQHKNFMKERPQFVLVQFSRYSTDNMTLKVVEQKKIIWPENTEAADFTDLEIKVKDCRAKHSAIALYGHQMKEHVLFQLERLKTEYLDKKLDEMDFEFLPLGDPWLLLQYREGSKKLTHRIVRLSETTCPTDHRATGGTVVWYNDGTKRRMGYMLRMSLRREELLKTLTRMMIESQLFSFPKPEHKKFKAKKSKPRTPAEKRQRLLGSLEHTMNSEKASVLNACLYMHGMCQELTKELEECKAIK